jgi:hypothetical protein
MKRESDTPTSLEQSGPDGFFSRTPGRDIFGPLDDHLPEVRIPAEVKLDAMRAANSAGLDLTAYLRERLYVGLYGAEHIGRLYQERARRVQGLDMDGVGVLRSGV